MQLSANSFTWKLQGEVESSELQHGDAVVPMRRGKAERLVVTPGQVEIAGRDEGAQGQNWVYGVHVVPSLIDFPPAWNGDGTS